MFRRLLPKEVGFFDYFEELARLSTEACQAFVDLTDGKADHPAQAARIKEIEHPDVVSGVARPPGSRTGEETPPEGLRCGVHL